LRRTSDCNAAISSMPSQSPVLTVATTVPLLSPRQNPLQRDNSAGSEKQTLPRDKRLDG